MSRLVRSFSAVALLAVLAMLIAACSGGDDAEGEVTPASADAGSPTSTTTSAAIATVESTETPSAASPTVEPSPTSPSKAATATSPAATPTESAAGATEPTGASTATALTAEEQALMGVLLAPTDLPGEWNELSRTVPEDDDNPGFCGAGEFPRADEQVAQVEVEMQSGDNTSFVLQNLTEFEEDAAIEAMTYARDSFSCTEFTDEDGTVFRVEPTSDPGLGDESFAIKVSFQVADAGELQGDFVFVRVGGLVSIVTALEFDVYDPERTAQVAELAAAKMDSAAGRTVGLAPEQESLLDALMTEKELPQGWNVLSSASPTDPEGWTGLCESTVNPAALDAIARVSVDFYEGLADSDATVQQVVTAYPTGGGDAAMTYERDSVNCTEWTTGGTTIVLTPAEYASDADDIFVVTFSYDDEQVGTVSGNWIVLQSGDLISNIIYTDPEGVDTDFAQDVIESAVERMTAVGSLGA